MKKLTSKAVALNDWLAEKRRRFGSIFDVVVGTACLVLTAGLVVVGIQVSQQSELGQQACVRSARYSPYIAKDLERRSVMPAEVARDYRDDIPTKQECE